MFGFSLGTKTNDSFVVSLGMESTRPNKNDVAVVTVVSVCEKKLSASGLGRGGAGAVTKSQIFTFLKKRVP